ncbi:MAG TPA: hypothetical protein PL158_07095 [Bacillota bacterium]|nr:hypothetical protein [Bacillota bacterium]HOL08593.1 hypothetical protein [Bacillota bacterium]
MKLKIKLLFLLTVLILAVNANANEKNQFQAAIFDEGNITTDSTYELCTSFTPDGKRVYFCKTKRYESSPFTIYYADLLEDGKWSEPKLVPFSGRYSDVDPFVAPDGSKLYFVSQRPDTVDNDIPKHDFDIWVVDLLEDGWGEPQKLGQIINNKSNQFYPTVSRSGTLYFSSMNEGTFGVHDIYCSYLINGEYTEPVNLGAKINTSDNDYEPFIDPDERYLIFCRNDDLYISFNDNGVWTEARSLGPKVNTVVKEGKPYVSTDGKYLYFTSTINGRGDIFRILMSELGIEAELSRLNSRSSADQ